MSSARTFKHSSVDILLLLTRPREWGNPFANQHNILTPGAGCQVFDCAANDANCYSTPSMKKVYGCPLPVDLEADLCI
jgi:hypothetical protein